MNDRRINPVEEKDRANPLKEVACRLQKLSYRDLTIFAGALASEIPALVGADEMCRALLNASDEILERKV